MDQAAESVEAADLLKFDHFGGRSGIGGRRPLRDGRSLVKGSVGPIFVVVARVLAVPVANQEPRPNVLVVSCMSKFLACWATQGPSGFVLIPAR